jgi:fructokinase
MRDPSASSDQERLREICRFACAVGALTTTERGAIPALPGYDRVRRFLNAGLAT